MALEADLHDFFFFGGGRSVLEYTDDLGNCVKKQK